MLKTILWGGWPNGWWEFLLHLPLLPRGCITLLDSDKAKALADSLKAVSNDNHSFDSGSYWDGWHCAEVLLPDPWQRTQANQPWRGSRSHQWSQGQQGSGPKQYSEQGLEASSQRTVSPLFRIFNVVLRTHHFPTVSKHAWLISILKLRKDLALPSSYQAISLMDTFSKWLEKILLAKALSDVSQRRLMRDEQFGFRPRHSTSLQLARLVESITSNFGEKRQTGVVFLDVAKAIGTIWIDGLPYKLMILKLPATWSKLSHHTFWVRRSKRPSRRQRHLIAVCGLAWRRVVWFPILLFCRISINFSKEHCDHLRKGWTAFRQAPTSKTFREINPVARHNTLAGSGPNYMAHLVASHRYNQKKKTVQRMRQLGPLLNRSDLSIRNGVLPYKQLNDPMMDYAGSS